jgi:hypothetical protein
MITLRQIRSKRSSPRTEVGERQTVFVEPHALVTHNSTHRKSPEASTRPPPFVPPVFATLSVRLLFPTPPRTQIAVACETVRLLFPTPPRTQIAPTTTRGRPVLGVQRFLSPPSCPEAHLCPLLVAGRFHRLGVAAVVRDAEERVLGEFVVTAAHRYDTADYSHQSESVRFDSMG